MKEKGQGLAEQPTIYRLYNIILTNVPILITSADGRYIPKGTAMLINLYAVNRNPEIWGSDAAEFNPKRFLSVTKDQITSGANTFGIGARSCIGEKMALADFEYAIVRLLQRVRLTGPDGPSSVNVNPTDTDIFIGPIQQDIVFQKL